MSAQQVQESNGNLVPNSQTQDRAPVFVGQRGIVLNSLEELWRFASAVSKSGLAPKGMDRPETILVAIQLGLELGLSPMAALQNIGVINGKPGVYGDAALALVEDSGLLEDFDEWYEVAGKRHDNLNYPAIDRWPDDAAAVCLSKRRGRSRPRITRFSVIDAKVGKVWGRRGRDGQDTPWITFPARMLRFRARGFNLRDQFPDVLKGLRTTEELADYPPVQAQPPAGRQSLRQTLPALAAEPLPSHVPDGEVLDSSLTKEPPADGEGGLQDLVDEINEHIEARRFAEAEHMLERNKALLGDAYHGLAESMAFRRSEAPARK